MLLNQEALGDLHTYIHTFIYTCVYTYTYRSESCHVVEQRRLSRRMYYRSLGKGGKHMYTHTVLCNKSVAQRRCEGTLWFVPYDTSVGEQVRPVCVCMYMHMYMSALCVCVYVYAYVCVCVCMCVLLQISTPTILQWASMSALCVCMYVCMYVFEETL